MVYRENILQLPGERKGSSHSSSYNVSYSYFVYSISMKIIGLSYAEQVQWSPWLSVKYTVEVDTSRWE